MSLITRFIALWQPQVSPTEYPRRDYIDWLRVLAFGSLIFFHTGMLYTHNWGFHYKSATVSESLEYIMLLFSPWRMGVIWFISGVALRYMAGKLSGGMLLISRTVKLLLPLLFGIWFIVPVQLYAQMTQETQSALSFGQFYSHFFDLSSPVFKDYQAGIWPHVDVNHLWYLRSLWQFTLIIILCLPLLNSNLITRLLTYCCNRTLLLVCFLFVPTVILRGVWGDEEFRYPWGFICLIYGYLLAQQASFWQQLGRFWRLLTTTFILNYCLILLAYHYVWLPDVHSGWALDISTLAYTFQRMLGVLTVLSLAQRFLNRSHPTLAILNKAVYPFYLLHQSVIIGLAFVFMPLGLHISIEVLLIITGTFLICTACFSIIMRYNMLRPLFGVKMQGSYSVGASKIGYLIGCLIVMPIAFEILL